MLKLTKTGIGLLTRQYRSVLHKCWLINVGLWQAMGDAVSKAVSVPARLIASLLSGGALSGEAFNVLDEILLSRLFERKLASLTAIGLGIAAATMPTEAEAGLLCYASDGTVKYTVGTACPAGTTTRLISLSGINSTAAIGSSSVALGDTAQATGSSSTAVGYFAQATNNYSTALGYMAKAIGESSMALGNNAQATSNFSTALGYQAQATGESSIAIGNKSVADEANTVSFGRFGADSATLAQMKADIDDGGMDMNAFKTAYPQYSQAGMLYMFYKNIGRDWDTAVEMSNIAGEYHRITNVADAVKAHDAVTLGQLQNNYYRKLMKKDEKFDTNEGIMDVKSLKNGTNSSQGRIIKGVSAFPSIMCAYPFDMPHTANDNHKNVIVRSAKHDVTIFGRQSDNTATTTKQVA